ncbi:MAG: peptidylprolyl isomerase, partial [Bacteroidota bacterium]
FEYVYQKNNGGWDAVKSHTQAQYKEYLDLYVNFKRKVLEAERLGLHEKEAFKSEFEGYRKQLAQPYLVDKSVQEKLVKEAYDRSQKMVSASHILIMCGPDAVPDDTMKAYNKAMAIRDSVVKKGHDFGAAAKKHSEDPSAKQNEGSLGYFTVFDMVYPFETGAFNTKVGDVSMPIRSGYGYHLIKVNDKVENTGKKTCAHIIIRVGPQYSAKTEEQAVEKISEIHKMLVDGGEWKEVCEKYSDDPNTAARGGDLGKGRLIPEMEDVKRPLGKGDFSKPFKTAFGHHIMKVTDVEEVKSFADSESEIKSRIARDARSTLSRDELIKRVKREYGFRQHEDAVEKLVERVEASGQVAQFTKGFFRPVDSINQDLYEMKVYTLGDDIGTSEGIHYGTMRDFFGWYVKARKGYEGATTRQVADKLVGIFVEEEMLKFEEMQLPKKHREYRELLKEYRDGILLFTLTEDKVWRKAVEDTTGLQAYYNRNTGKFMADARVKVTEYISEKRDKIDQVERLLAAGSTERVIDSIVNKTSALNCRIRTQTYEKGKAEKEAIMFGQKPGFRSAIMEYGKAWRLLVLEENIPAGQKSFEDAKSECITLYQNHLEEEWLAELKSKYPCNVNESVLETLYK